MATHVHFHDFLGDAFEESKHKRSHGKFATMSGPGAQQKNPGLKETKPSGARPHPKPAPSPPSRTATWTRQAQEVKAGAAARIARAVEAAKAQAGGLAKEAFAVPHDVDTLTKGFDQPGTPLRQKMGVTLAQNVGNYLKEMGKESVDTVRHGGTGLWAMANGLPMNEQQVDAWKAIGRKAVISTLMRSLDIAVPGAGVLAEAAGHAVGHVASQIGGHAIDHVTQHIMEHVAEHVVDHAAEEHMLKLGGAAGRVTSRLFGRQRRLGQQQAFAGGGDHAFRDNGPSPQEIQQLLTDWLQTVAKSLTNAPIDMKQIMASAPRGNGDAAGRFGPLFGGMRSSGNRLLDEGTSAGAKKGWQKRLHGQSTLRKAEAPTPPAPKPSFEQMRAKAQEYPTPTPPKPKRPESPKNPRKMVHPSHGDPETFPKRALDPSTGIKTQQGFFGSGAPRSKTRGGPAFSPNPRATISMGQRQREGPAQERQAANAAKQRAELRELHGRRGSLSPQEEHRMKLLLREHGGGALGSTQATMSHGGPVAPAKRRPGSVITMPPGYGRKRALPLIRR